MHLATVSARQLIYYLMLYGICGYALARGRTDARIIALVFFVGNYVSAMLQSPLATSYRSVETGIFVIDVVGFLVFTSVALLSDRFWPLWISGLQLTTIFGHFLKAVDSSLMPLAYAVALRFWSYPILIIIAVGVWRSERRRQSSAPATA